MYARVSSADQKADLDRQVARVSAWATTQKIPVDKVGLVAVKRGREPATRPGNNPEMGCESRDH